ncbi:hypothetical protein ABZ383_22700 [Streptomyces sp. NPDC005900]|uniref:plasmid mobilization protein n=1 Tax=Streptomyces sp. NPDC005900 TaxID=3154569 RepID=UPI0033E82F63
MSDDEFAVIEGRARVLGISVQRVLIEAAMGVPPLTRTERQALHTELTSIKRLLGNLTNNVNQIARARNSDVDVQPKLIAAVLSRAAAAAGQAEDLLKRLGLR